MLTTIIRTVIHYRQLVLLLLFISTSYAIYAIQTAPLDAIPDISDSQIIVYAKWARSPQQLETKITQPIIQALLGSGTGTAKIKSIRATSHLGYSFIYVIFENRNQRQQVRQILTDKLNAIRPQLPKDARVSLGPNASSLGWIVQYALVDHSKTRDLRELRLLNDSAIKPIIQAVNGIAEVATVGGLERQVELKIFPPLLAQAGITLRDVITALKTAFEQVGGRSIELTNRDYQLRGVVNTENLDKLEYLIIARDSNNEPIRIKDIGYFQVNYDLRRGIADLNGEGEVVGGIVVMEQDQNVLAVSRAYQQALATIKTTLPDGVEIITSYDRSELIWATLENFSTALLYELLIVILVIFWALRHARATIAPVLVIAFSCLFTLLSLSFFGQTINLLSLAGLAIAIGEMADASIVIVENCASQLARHTKRDSHARRKIIIAATARMMRPLLFSLLIIIASFLPVFFLGERETRLFDPLALSKTFAMGFSTLLTLVLLPIIIVWIFNGKSTARAIKPDNGIVRLYARMLRASIAHRYLFLSVSIVLLVFAVTLMMSFQKDYMPEMDEGLILYMPTTLPGLPIREAGWILQQIDRKIKAFPEVQSVFGKLGRADSATDSAPISMIETTIILKPKSKWRDGLTKEKLISEMDAALNIVGYVNSWTQPIAGRIIMQDTGIQTPVGIKLKGPDIVELEKISIKIESLLKNFSGTGSVIAERISQGYYIDVENDLQQLSKHNVMIDEALSTIRYGIGGDNVLNITQADNTVVPLSLQYSPEYIDTLEKVRQLPVITAIGQSVALHSIANVSVKKMPEMIRNDNGELAAYIYINPKRTQFGEKDNNAITAIDYVHAAKKILSDDLILPSGYSLEWTGTFQYAQQAKTRLLWIIPITLIIMFSLLLMTFKSISISFLVLLSTPFALIGGVILQYFQGYPLTTAVIIGYIAVLAVAIQTGIIMVEFIRESLTNRTESMSYMDAVVEGSLSRLRPKLMTVATTVLGLIPILMVTGSGMDVTRPIAAPSVGGMISSTIYVLFLIPCLFAIGEDAKKYFKSR